MWSEDGVSIKALKEVVIGPIMATAGGEKMSNCENERERGHLALFFNTTALPRFIYVYICINFNYNSFSCIITVLIITMF